MKNNDLIPPPRQSPAEAAARSRDLDLSAYFLVRRASTESGAVSPKFGPSRLHSYQKSPKARSQRSGGSSHGPCTKANSISSAQSTISKNQAIRDWNEKSIGLVTPSSTGCDSSHCLDPPRAPREGCEWVWFPEGYWAEREIPLPRKSGSRQKWWNRSPDRKSRSSARSESPEKTTPLIDLPRIKVGSLISRKSSSTATPNVDNSALASRKSSSVQTQKSIKNQYRNKPKKPAPAYYSLHQDEQLGLYCRTKKTLRSRFIQKSNAADDSSVLDVDRPTSRTTMLLQGTSHYLDRVQRERCKTLAPCLPSDAPQTPGSQSSVSIRRFGLAPWHRRSSHESILSASSSVFKLLLGKPPVATPNPEYQYQGIDGKTYYKVDIASPDPVEPTFLPSEAKRINTPPMFPGTPDIQARGFFFDLSPPRDGSPSPSSTTSNSAAKNRSHNHSPSLGWWEADTQHASTGNKTARPRNMDATNNHSRQTKFELGLPEHLPNSPLCPKHPKHQSGGTGICPVHGRKGRNHLTKVKTVDSQGSDSTTNERTPTGR